MVDKIVHRDAIDTSKADLPIAIIGMASIFPNASNLQEFWDNILNKLDCITDVPPSRWELSDYYDPDPKTPDKTYCKRGGFIPDVDFDPAEFGLPPNILESTDVSQLLSLLVAREALEDAGYNNAPVEVRDRTGVVLGTVVGQQLMRPLMSRLQYPVWQKVLKKVGLSDEATERVIEKMKKAYMGWEENSFPGFLSNVIAGRIANRLDLGGINFVVDAACASSLSAVKMAVNELTSYSCDLMLTGGVDIDNSILTYMCFSKTPAFSRKDRVRTFDAASDGMMAGEGIGMLVLKRLEDAERDGDRIYAVIRGVGASSDGRYKSIYAPRSEGQVKALARAYQRAGVDPSTIGLIEAHGTGTVAGDIAEVGALDILFKAEEIGQNQIALGSVKSQIGHTKAAAGAASLIKTALALYHKVLPATINVDEPNPKLNISDSAFYINSEVRPWFRKEINTPRRAGVSSFGFGGTNYHVVMEEYQGEHNTPYRVNRSSNTIILAGETPAQLLAQCQEVALRLQTPEASQHYLNLVEASKNLEIPVTRARVGFVAQNKTEALELLQTAADLLKTRDGEEAWEHPRGIFFRKSGLPAGKVVVLFPGQGAQYLAMGRELAINFPELRETCSALDQLFHLDGQPSLTSVVYPPPTYNAGQKKAQAEKLQRTDYAQPAIGALNMSLYKLMQKAGLKADFVAGHSFGELSALWAAGVLADEDYLKLARERGKAMATPATESGFDPGTMLAVTGDIPRLTQFIRDYPGVSIANFNSPQQVVLAGDKASIGNIQKLLSGQGFSVVPLPVSAAFHTPLVAHAQVPFAAALEKVEFRTPSIPVFSNSSAQPYPTDPAAIRKILVEHLLQPVLFQQEIENIYNQGGYYFIEVGPRDILTNLVKTILGDRPFLAVALNASRQKDSDYQLRKAVLQLRVAGLHLSDIDPYAVAPRDRSGKKPSVISVKLNGNNYVSEARKKAFDEALNDGYEVKIAMADDSKNQMPNGLPAALPPVAVSTPVQQEIISQEIETKTPEVVTQPQNGYHPALQALEMSMAQFGNYQDATLQVHEHYLNNQASYTNGFFQLMQQQQELLLNGNTHPAQGLVESLERNMMRFHDYQSETLRVHNEYLQHQANYSQNLFNLLSQQATGVVPPSLPVRPVENRVIAPPKPVEKPAPAPVQVYVPPAAPVPAPAPATVTPEPPKPVLNEIVPVVVPSPLPPKPVEVAEIASGPSVEELSKALLAIVSEKTGYPVEMLEPGMDMEADLGIDSIKRVEILGAMQDLYPDLPKLSNDELAEMRTLGHIIEKMSASSTPNTVNSTTSPVTVSTPATNGVYSAASDMLPAPVATPANGAVAEELSKALLAIVSEKTGYPVEMLEPGMDMEADLGIDSIKRVEILGAMQDLYPDLPKLSNDELAEMRTLGHIIEKMSGSSAPVPVVEVPVAIPENIPSVQISRGEVRLKYLPEPDYLEYNLSQNSVCLLTDDGTAGTAGVAQVLSQEGWRVVVLSFPQNLVAGRTELPEGIARVELPEASEVRLEQTLKEIAERFGPVSGFIHLNPRFESQNVVFLETEKTIVRQVFFVAKYLKKSLNEAARRGSAMFLTVTRLDGQLGLSGDTAYSAVGGGLFGLTKSLNLEWDNVYCRAVDLSPELNDEEAVRAIMAELHDPDRLISEVGYSNNGRFTLVSEEAVPSGKAL